MAWYDSNWSYRIPVTIDSTKVSADLTDFPVYVDLSDLSADFFSNVKTDGSDIRVTKDDGTTEVPREVVAIDTGSSTGELHFKADGTLSSSTDTDFYIYYGNASATEPATSATYGAENVWSSYDNVYHMQEDPSGSAPQIIDSTSNNRDGTSAGSMTSADLVNGQVGKSLDFDGSDDYLSVSSFGKTSNSHVTVEAWVRPDVTNVNQHIVDESNTASYGGGLMLRIKNDSGVRFWQQDAGFALNSASTLTAGNFYYLVGVYDGTKQYIYIDGVEDVNNTLGSTSARNAANPRIGRSSLLGGPVNGLIDEVRISGSARSADWISTQYNNQNSASTFYSAGAQETYTPSATFIPKITSVL